MEGVCSSGDLVMDKEVKIYKEQTIPLEKLLVERIDILEREGKDNAFFLVDLGEVYYKLEEWKRRLPRVEPFYALKCNNVPLLVRFLVDCGVGFDCASKAEIEQVLQLGVHPSRIVYANTCKQSSYITFAASNNVNLMTFDDEHELSKIKELFPTARLLLRIKTSSPYKAEHNMNKKFGCPAKHVEVLLAHAQAMKLNVIGISFHVGSLQSSELAFSSAIEDANRAFRVGQRLGFDMEILDIGGGFPGFDDGNMTFEKVAKVVNVALEKYFPESEGVRIIAEPGRYIAASAFTVAVNIIAKQIHIEENVQNGTTHTDKGHKNGGKNHCISSDSPLIKGLERDGYSRVNTYFINEGIYGVFCNLMTDVERVYPNVLHKKTQNNQKDPSEKKSIIWGPTCDQMDCVVHECMLPDLEIGRWLYFCNMGAYTICLATCFNGIERPLVYYLCSQRAWNKVYAENKILSSKRN